MNHIRTITRCLIWIWMGFEKYTRNTNRNSCFGKYGYKFTLPT